MGARKRRQRALKHLPCCGDPYSGEPVNSCEHAATEVIVGPYIVNHEVGWGVLLVTSCYLHSPLVLDYMARVSVPDALTVAPIEALPVIERELAGDPNVWRLLPAA